MAYLKKSICWKSCCMELVCLHAEKSCEHPLSVFEAVLKFSKRLLSSPVPFHFLPEQPLSSLKRGKAYRLRLVFPSASEEDVRGVRNAVRQWLEDPRNHFSVTFGEIAYEDTESAVAAFPCPAEEDICLEFFSPLALPRKARMPDGAMLGELLLDRVEKLFGPLPERTTLLRACEDIRIIPYDWKYREYRHASSSSGGTQFINGFQGRLVLCGDLSPLAPLVAICARTGCGPRLSFGLGAFRPAKADLLRQAWTSETGLLSSREFLNSHGYNLGQDCISALKQSVETGAPLSREALLLAQESLLRLFHKPVKRIFPLADREGKLLLPWRALQPSFPDNEAGFSCLYELLSKADRELLPLIREVWRQDGVPQMRDLRVRAKAGKAVQEAVSLGIDACLANDGISLGDPADREAMLDTLARQGILFNDVPPEESAPEEGKRLVPWKRSLHIIHPGAAVALDGDAITARFDGETLLRTPLGQVSALVLHGAGSVSTPLMRRCMAEDIPIVLCESGGRLTGSIVPQGPAWRKRSRDHARNWERLGETGRFAVAREIITAKIENYLCKTPRGMRNPRDFRAAGQKALAGARAVRSPRELLGVEGAFARVTFRAYNDCVVGEAFRSACRQPGCGHDLWNAALDTASYLTFQRIAMELVAEGLDPFLGIFHCQHLRYMTFAADIQELFRADTERWLLRVINQNILREEHFVQENGRFRLTRDGWRLFLLQWEEGMQTKFSWQPDSPARSLFRQIRSMRLWLCSGMPPELYTGTEWRVCNRAGLISF